jgi:heme/copper-type cytochrome/quinol oxidase subunit 2
MRSRWQVTSAVLGIACVTAGVFILSRAYERSSAAPTLTIRAIAHQWWWEFDYPSLGVRTSDVLHLPSGKDVQLELSSGDVIHSFWILGMKDSVQIVPGKARSIDLFLKSPGELYGNCDSGCGCGTVCMRFRVLASTPVEFQRWAADARLNRSEFKPPSKVVTPACALTTGHDGHAKHDAGTNRIQQLLDKG